MVATLHVLNQRAAAVGHLDVIQIALGTSGAGEGEAGASQEGGSGGQGERQFFSSSLFLPVETAFSRVVQQTPDHTRGPAFACEGRHSHGVIMV